MERNIAPKW